MNVGGFSGSLFGATTTRAVLSANQKLSKTLTPKLWPAKGGLGTKRWNWLGPQVEEFAKEQDAEATGERGGSNGEGRKTVVGPNGPASVVVVVLPFCGPTKETGRLNRQTKLMGPSLSLSLSLANV